jgi:hypothetical protein
MALGPGKYDALLTAALAKVRERHPGIHGGILMIVGPPEHPEQGGFTCQLTGPATLNMPEFLRSMADQIEADMKRGKL